MPSYGLKFFCDNKTMEQILITCSNNQHCYLNELKPQNATTNQKLDISSVPVTSPDKNWGHDCQQLCSILLIVICGGCFALQCVLLIVILIYPTQVILSRVGMFEYPRCQIASELLIVDCWIKIIPLSERSKQDQETTQEDSAKKHEQNAPWGKAVERGMSD